MKKNYGKWLTLQENTIAAIPRGRQQHTVLKMDQTRYVGELGTLAAMLLSIFHSCVLAVGVRLQEECEEGVRSTLTYLHWGVTWGWDGWEGSKSIQFHNEKWHNAWFHKKKKVKMIENWLYGNIWHVKLN